MRTSAKALFLSVTSGDDFYDMDEETYSLIGRRKKRRFRLGDPVTVKIANANLERKQLDFMLME